MQSATTTFDDDDESTVDENTRTANDNIYDDEGDDFIMKLMDSTCQGFRSSNSKESTCLPAACHVEQHLEMFTHCRQPLDFLSLFHQPEHCSDENNNDKDVVPAHNRGLQVMPGVYVTADDCEYCGAARLKDCDPRTCTRPALYFQKKRPPFCQPDASTWDPVTDHAMEPNMPNEETSESRQNYFQTFFKNKGVIL